MLDGEKSLADYLQLILETLQQKFVKKKVVDGVASSSKLDVLSMKSEYLLPAEILTFKIEAEKSTNFKDSVGSTFNRL